MSFPCPKCGHEQSCPCDACQKRIPTLKPWIWVDGEFVKCGGCGILEHGDWWMDAEYEYYESLKLRESDVNTAALPETLNPETEPSQGS